jgi:hypothetical protein
MHDMRRTDLLASLRMALDSELADGISVDT